ncbi:transposable element Tcb1 transposase [Trichonephila clavipes]|nr:transposable element Tcb1 transposase [Trichonephila clavipes]
MGTLPSSRRGKCVTLFGGVRGTPRNSSACKQQQGRYTNYCCNPYGKAAPHHSSLSQINKTKMNNNNNKFQKIGSRVGRNQTTVMQICDRWMQEGRTDRRGRSHLPQCITSRDDRQIVCMAVTDRSVSIAQHIESVTHHSVSALRIAGTLNSQRYIAQVLEPVVLPYLQGLATSIFQQDIACPHVARIVQWLFVNHQIDLLPWTARCPDRSPIENMWSMVAQRLTQIAPQLPHQTNFGNVWKLLGLLYPKREKKEKIDRMTRRRVENRDRPLGYPRFVKPVFTKDSKPLGKRISSLGHLGIVTPVLT